MLPKEESDEAIFFDEYFSRMFIGFTELNSSEYTLSTTRARDSYSCGENRPARFQSCLALSRRASTMAKHLYWYHQNKNTTRVFLGRELELIILLHLRNAV